MPRAPVKTDRDVPLFLIPHMIMKRVKLHSEDVERIIVRKTGSHYYTISTRTRSIKRELKGKNVPDVPVEPLMAADGGCES